MNSAMKLQEHIETAVANIMKARSGVNSNEVFRWIDRSSFRLNQAIIIQGVVRRIAPNYPMFEIEIHIGVILKGQEDLGGKRHDLLYAECSGEVHQDMTTATLQAAVDAAYPSSGIVVDGVAAVMEPGAGADDEVFHRWEAVNAYVTYTQPST